MRHAAPLIALALFATACEPSHDGFWGEPGPGPDDGADASGSCAADLALRQSMHPSDGFLSFGDASGFAAVRPDGDTLSAWLFTATDTDGGWYENATLPAGLGPIAEAEVRPLGDGSYAALARTAGVPTGAAPGSCDAVLETLCDATDFGAALVPPEGSGSGAEGSGEPADCTDALAAENGRIGEACIDASEQRCRESGAVSEAQIAAAGNCLDAVGGLPDGPAKDGLYIDLANSYTACLEDAPATVRDATEQHDLARTRCEAATNFTSGTLTLARLSRGTLRTTFADTTLLPAEGLSLVHDVEMARTGAGLLVALVGAPSADLADVEIRTALLDPTTGLPFAPAAAIDTTGCTLDREARDLTLTGGGDRWFLLGSSLGTTGLCLIPLDARGQRTAAPVRLIPGAGVDYAATFAGNQLWVARGTPMPTSPVELTRYDAEGSAAGSELLAAPFDCPLTSLKESALLVTGDALRVAYTAVCDDGTKRFYTVGRTTAGAPLSAFVATVDSTRNALFAGGAAGQLNYLYDATSDTYRVRTGRCEGP